MLIRNTLNHLKHHRKHRHRKSNGICAICHRRRCMEGNYEKKSLYKAKGKLKYRYRQFSIMLKEAQIDISRNEQ